MTAAYLIDAWQSSSMVRRLGLTLLHSLWEGAAAAIVLKAILQRTRRRPGARWSNIRYAAAGAAMVATTAAVAITFFVTAPAIESSSIAIGANVTAPPPLPAIRPAILAPATGHHGGLLSILVLGWLGGVLVLSLWQFTGWLRLQSWRSGRPLTEPRWQRALVQLAARMKITRAIALIGSARIDVPLVIGAFRPAILVPLSLLSELSPEQIQAIIAHELAHIRRHDYLVNLVQVAMETLFFHHPAIWWISGQIRIERENCCDDIAAGVCGGNLSYATALVVLEEHRGVGARLAPAATDGPLLLRLRRLLAAPAPRAAERRANLAMIPILASLLVAPLLPLFHGHPALAADPATAPAKAAHEYVNVTIGKDGFMAVEGGVGNWDTLHDQLAALSPQERGNTVIRIKAEFGDVPVSEFFQGQFRAQKLVDDLGLAYVSNTGIDPTAAPLSGEVYVGGGANRTGPYSITGRHVSVRQMLISAGGVTDNRPAWISIIRRASTGETHPMKGVSLDDLNNGRAVDLYLQANDMMIVSTKAPSPQ